MRIICFLIMGILLISLIFVSGCVSSCMSKCEKAFTDCNHECGEGILSSVCKEKCTFDYNGCKSACV